MFREYIYALNAQMREMCMCMGTHIRVYKGGTMNEKSTLSCEEWLKFFLLGFGDEPVDVSEIKRAAAESGYKKKELRDAKNKLRVVTTNNWCPGCATSAWYWSLQKDEE